MVRIFVFCLFFLLPSVAVGEGPLADLEKSVSRRNGLRPGLENYSARLDSNHIEDVLEQMSQDNPNEMPPPVTPKLVRYWQRGKNAFVAAEENATNPITQKVADHFSRQLASGMDWTLVPAERREQRRKIAGKASVKSSTTRLGQTTLKRIELFFETPTSLNGAFYPPSFPLPQEAITSLYIDLDVGTSTIQEVGLLTQEGLKLTTEMRYLEVPGGSLVERIKITSLDGDIDDLIEIAYQKIDGFDLPVKFTKSVNRPGSKQAWSVAFEDFKINQPFSEEIRNLFQQQL